MGESFRIHPGDPRDDERKVAEEYRRKYLELIGQRMETLTDKIRPFFRNGPFENIRDGKRENLVLENYGLEGSLLICPRSKRQGSVKVRVRFDLGDHECLPRLWIEDGERGNVWESATELASDGTIF